jgi:hypothetical protein
MLTATAQISHRLIKPYHEYPLRLARLVDHSLSFSDRLQEATLFHRTHQCCLDPHFGIPLQNKTTTPATLLTSPMLVKSLRVSFMTKNVNLEVETNFARAANQRAAQRGRAHCTASLASKHVISEIALAHRRWCRSAGSEMPATCAQRKRALRDSAVLKLQSDVTWRCADSLTFIGCSSSVVTLLCLSTALHSCMPHM